MQKNIRPSISETVRKGETALVKGYPKVKLTNLYMLTFFVFVVEVEGII